MFETVQAVNSVQAFTIFHQNQSSPQSDQHENRTIIWSTQTHTSKTSRVTAPAVSGSKSFMSNHSHRLGPYEKIHFILSTLSSHACRSCSHPSMPATKHGDTDPKTDRRKGPHYSASACQKPCQQSTLDIRSSVHQLLLVSVKQPVTPQGDKDTTRPT